MINVFDFACNSNVDDFYALVSYNNKVEPTHFHLIGDLGHGLFYLHSPCCTPMPIHKFTEQEQEDVKQFCVDVLLPALFDIADTSSYEMFYDDFVKHMIVDNVLYEIPVFQCEPYLPEEVDDIKILSEGEMLRWMLKNNEEDNNE